jgi:L-glyceraldehyde 3-phosphate reductase
MYQPSPTRYNNMPYNRCGNSGLLLPAISLGLWHNFGNVDDFENARTTLHILIWPIITDHPLAKPKLILAKF